MPGHGELLTAAHPRSLDEDDVASHRRPHQPHGDSRPLDALFDFLLRAKFWHAQELANNFRRDDHFLGLVFGDAPRLFARDRGDLALQVAHARFPREAVNDFPEPLVGEGDLLVDSEAVLRGLLRDQVLVGNVQLLFSRVARQFDDFHAVPQRLGDGIHPVRRGDEQDLRKIKRHIQIVITEGVVLLRVENFHQRRRGIAPEVAAEFVDLVKHHDRVVRFSALQTLNNLSGQRADVSPPMAADLRLVVHTAKGDAHKLASQRPGDRLTK